MSTFNTYLALILEYRAKGYVPDEARRLATKALKALQAREAEAKGSR